MTVLDLETTSVEPDGARIVTAAVGYVGGGKPTDVTTLVAAVDVEIPDEAAAIHGYTTARARRDGRPIMDVLDIILGYLDRRPDGSAVVVFNARYDLTVLDRECRRHGIDGADAHRQMFVVDPLVVDKHLDPYRPGKRKLAVMCEHYRAKLAAAHQSESDALAAGRLAWRIGKVGVVVRSPRDYQEECELEELRAEWRRVRDDLPALHAAQARWAERDAESLERFFREGNERKGVPAQPGRVVPREWPVLRTRAEAAA